MVNWLLMVSKLYGLIIIVIMIRFEIVCGFYKLKWKWLGGENCFIVCKFKWVNVA